MKILITGYGSIGKRHEQVLAGLKPEAIIDIVSTHLNSSRFHFSTLQEVEEPSSYDYFVISSRTADHFHQLKYLDSRVSGKTILIEKPLFHESIPYSSSRNSVFVGYNLRYHPLIIQLKNLAAKHHFRTVNAIVGQYLPDWRPGTDYRNSYSSSARLGGGVLLDLSHELDYLQWVFGPLEWVQAAGGKVSRLEIDVEDAVSIIGKTSSGMIQNISLDYLSRIPVRRIHAIADDLTCIVDLIEGTLKLRSETADDSFSLEADFNRNSTYYNMHKDLLEGNDIKACTLQEGVSLLKTIGRIRCAMGDGNES